MTTSTRPASDRPTRPASDRPNWDRAWGTMSTRAGVRVRFDVVRVGVNAGICARLTARNGRIMWEGPVRPAGSEVACANDAGEWCGLV